MSPDIILLGAGRMGGALLARLVACGVPRGPVWVYEPHPSDAVKVLMQRAGGVLNPQAEADMRPRALVVAVKPSLVGAALAPFSKVLSPDTLVISIAAGVSVGALEALVPSPIVRAMPNTPARLGKGITALYASPRVTEAHKALCAKLMRVAGELVWCAREDDFDAITAVSGAGPAYVFYLTECLARAGVAAGLEAGLAARLARASVVGAGALMEARAGVEPAALRGEVASPGGATQAALELLMRDDALATLFARAIAAGAARSRKLG